MAHSTVAPHAVARRAVAPRARHLLALTLFGALTVGWTWPLVRHLHDAIPGDPGDNYSFLWYLWWMRHVMATPGLSFFHTDFLFHPFGASIANNPHTALPAFVAATLLGRASIVTAQNGLLLAYVFANMAVMYALAFDVAGSSAGAVLAAVIFGLSPYVAAHFPGHFELTAVWTLPAFAFFFRRACRGSLPAAAAAGLAAAATAYTSYYYFVYEAIFAAAYAVAWFELVTASAGRRRGDGTSLRAARSVLVGAIALLLAAAAWIAITGGGTIPIGRGISATRPQGPLGIMWVCVLAWVLCSWRIRIRKGDGLDSVPGPSPIALATVTAVTVVGITPLLWQGVRLMMSGEYVSPTYFWRSAPRGIDALTPLLGHPASPLYGGASARIYAALGLDPIESIGWLGIIPVIVLFAFAARHRAADVRDRRAWTAVGAVFAIWAAGPFLTIGGFDTGLKLPEILARWIPFVSNARMPGRAVVGVFLAIAVLAALATRTSRAVVVWPLVALVVVEFWASPIRLTPLDTPAVYRALAVAPPGPVCEVPFGVGDGLSRGAGSQDRRVLYYATLHEHPLVGGYLGRMPTDVDLKYDALPLTRALIRLSDGRPLTSADSKHDDSASPCTYLVVNRAAARPALLAYVRTLPTELLAADDARDLLRLR